MRRSHFLTTSAILVLVGAGGLQADGGVVFLPVDENTVGVDYRRQPSQRVLHQVDFELASPIPNQIFFDTVGERSPQRPFGAPGVALLDFDGDGDLDAYVTNGPNANNSLFSNQLQETGQFQFVDVGNRAGVALRNQDSAGVCFGDIDNDGDSDLYVLGTGQPNRLLENQGDGGFRDITQSSGAGGGNRHPATCTFLDFNNDGNLDIAVANTYDNWDHRIPDFDPDIFPGLEHNQLFQNQGGNVFVDVSGPAGLHQVSGMGGPGRSGAGFTWGVSAVDYDLDGDTDLFFADTQGVPDLSLGSERGFVRLYENNGGVFSEVTDRAGLDVNGNFTGLSFGDLNCDGDLDFFASNVGAYVLENGDPSRGNSRWFLGDGAGGFNDPGVGDLTMTPFGWGSSVFDYDNDGDIDVVFHGGQDDVKFMYQDNPGVLLRNRGDCSGVFVHAANALPVDHRQRALYGLATGDLNGDGFIDLVDVASHSVDGLTVPYDFLNELPGGFLDGQAQALERWTSFTRPGFQDFTNPTTFPGTVEIQLNSADNGNGFVHVDPRGSIGTLPDGTVSRDGTGAVVMAGGSVYQVGGATGLASQGPDSVHIGLGPADFVDLEIFWPGGVRNRLDGVAAGEHVVLPEIPCDFEDQFIDARSYGRCLSGSLEALVDEGLLSPEVAESFWTSGWEDDPPADSCGPFDPLCFNGGRFKVSVTWRDFAGVTGSGSPADLRADDSGLLWFFDAENWEMLIKVLDGCAINDRFWVFAAATTNVEYNLTVTDTATGDSKSYDNDLGVASPAITDTTAFETCAGGRRSADFATQDALDLDALAAQSPELASHARAWASLTVADSVVTDLEAAKATCNGQQPGLCLNNDRFSVAVDWETRNGNRGRAFPVPGGSDDSGVLWFFQPDNWEMLVKVLNGCAINQRYWVFAAATTDVGYSLQVTDTSTGAKRTYTNPVGNAAPALTDISAFARCP